jgi:hypothetical protein
MMGSIRSPVRADAVWLLTQDDVLLSAGLRGFFFALISLCFDTAYLKARRNPVVLDLTPSNLLNLPGRIPCYPFCESIHELPQKFPS